MFSRKQVLDCVVMGELVDRDDWRNYTFLTRKSGELVVRAAFLFGRLVWARVVGTEQMVWMPR